MYTSFWSVKGGVGVSTVAALHAVAVAGLAQPTLLVDPRGDQPALLGVDEALGPGLHDWIVDGARDPSALDRIAIDATSDLAVLPAGSDSRSATDRQPEALRRTTDTLTAHRRHVVVDCGLADAPTTRALLEAAGRRFLVVRSCYLTLRAARAPSPEPDGIVVVHERGRALGPADVEAVTGHPVVAEIAHDLIVARATDAGLLTSRIPRGLRRTMEGLARVEA